MSDYETSHDTGSAGIVLAVTLFIISIIVVTLMNTCGGDDRHGDDITWVG